jgi:hypothetical protein
MSEYEGWIAGVRVVTNREIEWPSETARGAASSEVRFVSSLDNGAGEWLSIPNPATRTDVRIRRDGRKAAIVADPPDAHERARQMRWAVPFIAALEGETVLHASAVERDGCLYGFIAESGTGKSTFASVLEERGWRKASDDLLPQCLLDEARRVALFFLRRPAGGREAAWGRLTQEEAFPELISNGFGELPDPAIWETHFRFYCRLLERAPFYALTIPDGLDRLADAAVWWEQLLAAEELL